MIFACNLSLDQRKGLECTENDTMWKIFDTPSASSEISCAIGNDELFSGHDIDGETFGLQHDDARPCRDRIGNVYLKQETIRILWPARSPELNSIQQVLEALGRCVSALHTPPRTHAFNCLESNNLLFLHN
ncbi:hypothetical protein TNCV_2906941 [Trichonephila clavipes]|nr:hypothetical protein TNCV_2906941 [Trichonephila clavipes]